MWMWRRWPGRVVGSGQRLRFSGQASGAIVSGLNDGGLVRSRRGRPSVPAPGIASALVMQALQDLSDRETAAAWTSNLRWKAACGYGLTDTSLIAGIRRLGRDVPDCQELLSTTLRGMTTRAPASSWPGRTWNRGGLGRDRRAVADGPQGRPGPDDLHRCPGRPARA
jgi:hypothetical protein